MTSITADFTPSIEDTSAELAAMKISIRRFLRVAAELAIEKGTKVAGGIQFKASREEIAERLGVTVSTISEYIKEAEKILNGTLIRRHNNGWIPWRYESGWGRKFLINSYTIGTVLLSLYETFLKYVPFRKKKHESESPVKSAPYEKNPTHISVGKNLPLLYIPNLLKNKKEIGVSEKIPHNSSYKPKADFLKVPKDWIKTMFGFGKIDPVSGTIKTEVPYSTIPDACDIIANIKVDEILPAKRDIAHKEKSRNEEIILLQETISSLPEQASKQVERKTFIRKHVLDLCRVHNKDPKILIQIVKEVDNFRPDDTRKYIEKRLEKLEAEDRANNLKRNKGIEGQLEIAASFAKAGKERDELDGKIQAGEYKRYGIAERLARKIKGEVVDFEWEKGEVNG